MKIDPLDVISSSITMMPVRIIAAYLTVAFGATLPLVCVGGFGVLEDVGWSVLFLPLYLTIVAAMSGWWAFVALPLIFILAYKGFKFMVNDNTGSDLSVLALLSYLIAVDMSVSTAATSRLLVGVLLVVGTIYCVRRDRYLYPE